MLNRYDLEGIAKEHTDRWGFEPGDDILQLGKDIGLHVVEGPVFAQVQDVLWHDSQSFVEERARIRVAHEIAHKLLEKAGEDRECERSAWAIASALLMPASQLKRDLSVTDWDLESLQPKYNVSWEMMARRVPQVAGTVSRIWDNGELTRSWRSPWLYSRGYHGRKPFAWEVELAERCRSARSHVDEREGVGAWYVPNGDWQRVLVVSQIEAWEAR